MIDAHNAGINTSSTPGQPLCPASLPTPSAPPGALEKLALQGPALHPASHRSLCLTGLKALKFAGKTTVKTAALPGADNAASEGREIYARQRIGRDLIREFGNIRWIRATVDGAGFLLDLENKNGDFYIHCREPEQWYRRLTGGGMEKAIMSDITLREDGIVTWQVSGSDNVRVADYPDGGKFTDWGDGKATVMNKQGRLVTIRKEGEGFIIFAAQQSVRATAGRILAIAEGGTFAISKSSVHEPITSVDPWPDQNYKLFGGLHVLF